MKELKRNQLAAVKRVAKITNQFRVKRNRLNEKIESLKSEVESIDTMINQWEEPIKQMTGGLTSEEVLNSINNPVDVENTECSTECSLECNCEVVESTEVSQDVESDDIQIIEVENSNIEL